MNSLQILGEFCKDYPHSFRWNRGKKQLSQKQLLWYLDTYNREQDITDRTSEKYQKVVTQNIKIEGKVHLAQVEAIRDGYGILKVEEIP